MFNIIKKKNSKITFSKKCECARAHLRLLKCLYSLFKPGLCVNLAFCESRYKIPMNRHTHTCVDFLNLGRVFYRNLTAWGTLRVSHMGMSTRGKVGSVEFFWHRNAFCVTYWRNFNGVDRFHYSTEMVNKLNVVNHYPTPRCLKKKLREIGIHVKIKNPVYKNCDVAHLINT